MCCCPQLMNEMTSSTTGGTLSDYLPGQHVYPQQSSDNGMLVIILPACCMLRSSSR